MPLPARHAAFEEVAPGLLIGSRLLSPYALPPPAPPGRPQPHRRTPAVPSWIAGRMVLQDQINSIEKAAFVFCSEARTQSKRVAATASDGAQTFIILIRVFYREDKVVFDSGNHAYVRIGDEKHALTLDEIRELQIDKGQLDFEQEASTVAFPGEFDAGLLSRFFVA